MSGIQKVRGVRFCGERGGGGGGGGGTKILSLSLSLSISVCVYLCDLFFSVSVCVVS